MAYALFSPNNSHLNFASAATGQSLRHEQSHRKVTPDAGTWRQADPCPRQRGCSRVAVGTPSRVAYAERPMTGESSATGEGYGYPVIRHATTEILDVRDSLAEKANADRVALLQRKYDNNYKLTDQEVARLQILNERICRLFPGITREENDELEAMAILLAGAQNELELLREEFGHE